MVHPSIYYILVFASYLAKLSEDRDYLAGGSWEGVGDGWARVSNKFCLLTLLVSPYKTRVNKKDSIVKHIKMDLFRVNIC